MAVCLATSFRAGPSGNASLDVDVGDRRSFGFA